MIGLALFVCLCVSLSIARAAPPEKSSPAAATTASNAFGFELYARVKVGQKNVICSPASASIALAMALAGARGSTLQEMTRVLHLDGGEPRQAHASFAALLETLNKRDGQEGVALRIADRLWGQKDLKFEPDYLRLLRGRYRAPLEQVDFVKATEAARVAINRWTAVQTHGLIPEILKRGDLTGDARLVLTNAVYFKGRWATEFSQGETADRPFAAPDGKVVAKLMHKQASLKYARAKGVQLVELDYRGGLSMVVVLPDLENGLDAVEARLADSYHAWSRALDYKLIDLRLPRWKVTSRLSLADALAAMGMPTAFSQAANFTGIAQARPLFLHRVLQQAFANVDEAGTEAAAVTAIIMGITSKGHSVSTPIPFHADHPFLYLIRDTKTGVILFIGRVVDPR
jgi:serpin B